MKYKTIIPFKPITILQSEVNITNEFADKALDWCMKSGLLENNGVITTFDSPFGDPHEEAWAQEVLKQISPIDQFYNSWIQLYYPNSFHASHNHISDDVEVSGCLYLSAGLSTIFTNPLYPSRHKSITNVGRGSVLLWDPALYHSSPPADSKRLILAFNLKHHADY
jgi:hypothetical protein